MSLLCLENLLKRLSRSASCACRLPDCGYLRSSVLLRSVKERGSHWLSGGSLYSYTTIIFESKLSPIAPVTSANRTSDEHESCHWGQPTAPVTSANHASEESQPHQWREPTAPVMSPNRTSDESQTHQWWASKAQVTRADCTSDERSSTAPVTTADRTSDECRTHQWRVPTALYSPSR